MKIMIGIGHPKQVYSWKNILENLSSKGHDIKIVVWEKDITIYLLDIFGIKYEVVEKNYKGLFKKVYGTIKSEVKLIEIAARFKPDILVGGAPYLAHISKLFGKPHIFFTDTEHANLSYLMTYPFTDIIITPSSFLKKISKRHISINGYFQLMYLHPNYFKPDSNVLRDLGLSTDDKFIIVRFVAWNAIHDVGEKGFIDGMKVIDTLKNYGRVFISYEGKMPKELEKYKLKIAPEKFHSLLNYASLYIGEGGSTATEAALIGTPSIHISTTAKFCGVFDDLSKYNLIYTFDDDHKALEKAIEILNDPKSKEKWIKRKDTMLREKKDVTKFITELIEGYPESYYLLKKE